MPQVDNPVFLEAMDTILVEKQDAAKDDGVELDMEDLKDVVYEATLQVIKNEQEAEKVKTETTPEVVKETLVAMGIASPIVPGTVEDVTKRLAHADNATTVEEVTRINKFLALGLLPKALMTAFDLEDKQLVADMEAQGGPLPEEPADWGEPHEPGTEGVVGQ